MKLEQLYYDPKSPAGYAGEQALYKLAKQSSKKLNFKMLETGLENNKLILYINLFVKSFCDAKR